MPNPKPLKDAPPHERAADRIRRSARELFYSEGIRAIGVDEIVNRAGVTKPSLYRTFPSKDALAAAYLEDYDRIFWSRFDEGAAKYPDDPRAQLRHYFAGLLQRATQAGYRGCGLTNAAVEYPQADHPARKVAEANKRALRKRLRTIAASLGADDPNLLGDGLLLLLEGVYASGQLFGKDGPARALVDVADRLIDASIPAAKKRAKKAPI